jgi:GNAT superfamily N-acetyltransferase
MEQRTGPRSEVRQAVEYDLVELLRLRALLFDDPGDGWLDSLAVVLKEQLTADDVRVLVVDGGEDRLAAWAIGTIEQRLPGPRLHNGRVGQVIGAVTDPAHRRSGHRRALTEALLDWFRDRGVARVELDAGAEGEPLYRELGFTDRADLALSRRP